jgi:MFS family permease
MPVSDAHVRAARRAITIVFALNGVVFGSWAARIPAIRDRLELGDGQLGIALAGLALGAIVAMPVGGAIVARRGSAPVVRAAVLIVAAAIAIVALAPSLPVLCLGTVVLGIANGSLDVTMNAHGVAVEKRHGRPILAGFHAAFSAGGLVGSALGALAAAGDLDVRAHLALVGVAAAVIGTIVTRRLLPASEDALDTDEPVFVRPPRRLWALGALAFACLLIEGACADWSGVYLDKDLDAGAAVAALGFAAFSVTMVLGRLFGDRLVNALGARVS